METVLFIALAIQAAVTLYILSACRGARHRQTRVRNAARRFARDYRAFERNEGVYGR